MKWRVLVTSPPMLQTIDRYSDWFKKHEIEIELPRVTQQMEESQLLEIIEGFDGVIAGDDPFTARVLVKGKRLRVIAKWGVGVDAIDLEAAKGLGIQVFNTPNVFGDEVADVVMGYMILLARKLHKLDQSVREGGWLKVQGVSLRSKSLGVIGLGSVGRSVVRRGTAAGMSALGYDLAPVPRRFIRETGLRLVSFQELLESSDFISINCNLTPDNYHMISTQEFDLMKPGVYIINTARGALIDEAALFQALSDSKVAGAALDVFEKEPLPPDSQFHRFDNCILGTHNSSNTLEAVLRVNEVVLQNLLKGLGNQIKSAAD